jgi:hypothetical protein
VRVDDPVGGIPTAIIPARREHLAVFVKPDPGALVFPGSLGGPLDTIDTGGTVTLRHRSKLYHIGVGRRHAGTKVTILIAGLDIRILTRDGTLLRQLTLDPARNYQPQGLPVSP